MSDAPGLDEFAEAVARRVVELLADQPSSPAPPASTGPRLLTARQVADRLGRSTDWVRSHRVELGQVPGVGARPRLLFDAAAVDHWATARQEVVRSSGESVSAHPVRARGRGLRAGSGVDLLPIRGDRRAA